MRKVPLQLLIHRFSTILTISVILLVVSCSETPKKNLINDYPALSPSGLLNAVIEIPAGTNQKWEVNKSTGILEWEKVDGKHRIIDYIGYPGNYGFVPQTMLNKDSGGDGDPLDILVLGPPEERGEVIQCKLLGVLKLQDRGEQDDKLIAVSSKSLLFKAEDINSLDTQYPGVLEIIELWFSSYKGPGKMISAGFKGLEEANHIVESAIIPSSDK